MFEDTVIKCIFNLDVTIEAKHYLSKKFDSVYKKVKKLFKTDDVTEKSFEYCRAILNNGVKERLINAFDYPLLLDKIYEIKDNSLTKEEEIVLYEEFKKYFYSSMFNEIVDKAINKGYINNDFRFNTDWVFKEKTGYSMNDLRELN